MLEVELKFPIADPAGFTQSLLQAGAVAEEVVTQSDAYFNHPSRDFAVTDEALRLRTVGCRSMVTYKGAKLGGAAKSRYELELPLADATYQGWSELLERLGFVPVMTVQKKRSPYKLQRQRRAFEVVVDEVKGLGWFAEIETMVEASEQKEAESAVVNLASELGLFEAEPRSYLEMVLAR